MAATGSVQPDPPRRGIKALLARHPLVFYFVIAYAFAWLAEMPIVLSQDGAGLLSYRSPLGLYTSITIATFVGPIFIGVHHDGHSRREVGCGPLTAPVGGVAGEL